jgi:hypothetical protein
MLNHSFDHRRKKWIWWFTRDKYFTIAGREYIVPADYQFDGATVPRLLWWLFNIVGVTFYAAALHDWLYDTRAIYYGLSRKQVDELFYLHMRQDGTHIIQAWLMYKAVRLFGAGYWNRESFPYYLLDAKQAL